MAVFPLVVDIEWEGDATVDNESWATPHGGGCDQTDAMGSSLVDVEDVSFAPPQVSSQPRGGNRVPSAPKREFEEREVGVGTGRFEITASPAPDPHFVSPKRETSGCLQHLHHRPGGESVLVDQVEDSEQIGHVVQYTNDEFVSQVAGEFKHLNC